MLRLGRLENSPQVSSAVSGGSLRCRESMNRSNCFLGCLKKKKKEQVDGGVGSSSVRMRRTTFEKGRDVSPFPFLVEVADLSGEEELASQSIVF